MDRRTPTDDLECVLGWIEKVGRVIYSAKREGNITQLDALLLRNINLYTSSAEFKVKSEWSYR